MIAGLGSGVAGGYYGWKQAQQNRDFDTEDRVKFFGSSVVTGLAAGTGLTVAGALALKTVSFGDATRVAKGLYGMGKASYKGLTLGSGKILPTIRIPKGAGKPLAGLAMLAAGIGAIAYSYRSDPQTAAYAASDGAGGAQYNSTRSRLDSLRADGNILFGLNNLRHG